MGESKSHWRMVEVQLRLLARDCGLSLWKSNGFPDLYFQSLTTRNASTPPKPEANLLNDHSHIYHVDPQQLRRYMYCHSIKGSFSNEIVAVPKHPTRSRPEVHGSVSARKRRHSINDEEDMQRHTDVAHSK